MALLVTWKDGITLLSLVACILGLLCLWMPRYRDRFSTGRDEIEATESMLLLMSFAYWGVHCLALGAQRMPLPNWDMLIMSLKFTAVLTYFLTAACILSLPLTRFAASQQIEE